MVEGFGFGAVDEALEDDGAIDDGGEGAGGDREVIADEVDFGEVGFAGEVGLIGMGDADLAAFDDY